MAISIGDALLHLGVDSSALDAGLKGIKNKMSEISTAWVGVGAAIIGGMGLMIKSAAEEEANIGRLSIALKNVGVSYDSVKVSLEGVISATQRKTGIADTAQRDALNKLLIITGDYNKSLSTLPIVLDLAAAAQLDTTTAATLLGRVLEGDTGALNRYGIKIKEGATETEILAEIVARTGGAAEAAANPFTILGAEIGDLGEQIGRVLLPTVKDLIGKFVDIIGKVKEWVDANPQFVKALAAGAIAVGGIITVVFALKAALLLLGTTTNIMFGGILIAIGLLVTEIAWLLQNMTKMQHFYDDLWSNMKEITFRAVDAILGVLSKLLGFIPGLGDKIDELRKKLTGMIRSEELQRQIRDVVAALEDTKEIIAETAESTVELTDALVVNKGELELQQAQLEKQVAAYQSLQEEVRKTRQQFDYENSDAGRLGITLRDVTFTLFGLGYSNDEVTKKLSELGAESDNVNAIMKAFGLTTEAVSGFLIEHNKTLDASAKAYEKQADKAAEAAYQIAKAARAAGYTGTSEGFGGGKVEPGMSPYQVAYALGYDFGKLTPEQYKRIAGITGIAEFQHGGLITEPTLLTRVGSSIPYGIMAEKGPEPIGFGGVNITGNNFYVRQESDIDKIAEALVSKIRLKTGARI